MQKFTRIVASALLALVVCAPAFAQEEAPAAPLQDLSDVLTGVVERVAPSTVQIFVERKNEPALKEEEIPRDPMAPVTHPKYFERPAGCCAGTLFTEDGYIITSNFNVTGGEIGKIFVYTHDGKKYEAAVKGREENWDLAVLKIDATGLQPIQVRAEKPAVGEWTMVVAKSQNYDTASATFGIVSGVDRLDGQAVQFSARTNFSNTGGALVDLEGRMIGVANRILRNQRNGLNTGVSFGRPWHEITTILDDLKNGKIFEATRSGMRGPFLGIQANVEAVLERGVEIESVIPGTSAQEGGLQAGDIVLEADGIAIIDFNDLRRAIQNKKVGDKITLIYKRGETQLETTFILKERPSDY